MTVPFHIHLLSGCLLLMTVLSFIGLFALDLPAPAGFASGLAIAAYDAVWGMGIYAKYFKHPPTSGPTAEAEGQNDN